MTTRKPPKSPGTPSAKKTAKPPAKKPAAAAVKGDKTNADRKPAKKRPSSPPDAAASGSGALKKVARYARVGTAAGGLAAKLAGQKYFGIGIDKAAHADGLRTALGNMKGPLLKVAQLLSTIPNALPREYAEELRQLQSNAPPMGPAFVRRRMAAELGANWRTQFADFDETASAAASLGQVHRATLKDGTATACKLQYPDMQSTVSADLDQLKVFFAVFEKYDRAIITDEIYDEMAERLYEELDYTREAKHARLYAHILADTENVHVPQVIDDLSTHRLLTATWLEGKPVLSYVGADAKTRSTIALNLFYAWYVPLYRYGIIHGDPHPGNYTVRDDLGMNLLDFGCVRIFPPSFIEGVITLYHALSNDDRDMAAHAYALWGFRDMTNDMLDILNTWARFLYGPILENAKRPIGVVGDGIYGRETAHEVHHALRQAGGVTIPREFVFMDRAALGLGSVFLHLKAEVNWHRLFNELIEGFDPAALQKRQAEALKRFDLTP